MYYLIRTGERLVNECEYDWLECWRIATLMNPKVADIAQLEERVIGTFERQLVAYREGQEEDASQERWQRVEPSAEAMSEVNEKIELLTQRTVAGVKTKDSDMINAVHGENIRRFAIECISSKQQQL